MMPVLPKSYHVFHSIGIIRTPYKDIAPYQPVQTEEGSFKLVLESQYAQGLKLLHTFKYIYVIYALDKVVVKNNQMLINPPWAPQIQVGIFASRTPNRPNPIGISIVKLLGVSKNVLRISAIDCLDGTPLLDIKPYIDELDAKSDANTGWVIDTDNTEHLSLHIKGIPHKH